MILFDVTNAWQQVLQESGSAAGPYSASSERTAQALLPSRAWLRAVKWLKAAGLRTVVQTKSRRLRVRETTSLGEKRLLAIVAVDGVDYLIGAGTASISLLTRLEPTAGTGSSFASVLEQQERKTDIS